MFTAILILLVILVNLKPVQNFLAQKAVAILADKLKTKVSLKSVKLSLFNEVQLEQLYIEDQQKDTLLYAGEASVKITDWFFFRKHPVISYVGLTDANVKLYRTRKSDVWNYQFVIDAFASKSSKPSKNGGSDFDIDLRNVELANVRYSMIDAWVGSDMVGAVQRFSIDARKIDFTKKVIAINSISGKEVLFGLRDYKGGRPPKPKVHQVPVVDTTPFNPGHWKVNVTKLNLENSRFFLDDPDSKAIAGFFDPYHMDVTGIDFEAKHIAILGDTLTADLNHFSAKERCGFVIKKLAAKVKVSPIISECKNLQLITGNSNLGDYYAMHYKRFPDFLDYISKVVMVGHLNKSEVGIEDIAYFAPALERYRNLSVIVSGKSIGPVDNLKVTDLRLDDGFTKFSGNLSMKGLPDIDATFIDYQNGIIQTSGLAAYAYAPELKGQAAIDLKSIQSLLFKGSFTGFISDFKTKGSISSNLGNLTADVHMKLPYGLQSTYSGTISTSNFDIGRLLNQELFGKITFDATVVGHGFDADYASIDIKGKVKSASINGYDYQNVSVDGVLAKKQFDGTLIADDPNLQLNFDGKLDFSKERPAFNMYANVKHADIKAIGLSDDYILAAGEMQLNFEGNSIDNFIGSAKVYNLQITQDSIPLNIDSITLVSRVNDSNYKELILTSNEINAKVTGRFSLLDLPASAQMFLSYYLPEYVKPPIHVNETQNLQFDVDVRSSNDLIALFNKSIKLGTGARFSGGMDMPHQQFSFTGTLPSFNFGAFRLNNIQINSIGTYTGLQLNMEANGFKVNDQDLASTIQFQTNIFRDSAIFQLSTTTPTTIGSAEVNGTAYANNDSFYVSIKPSQFYLNNDKWIIPQGNQVVFAKNFIAVKNLNLESGVQSLRINNDGKGDANQVVAHIKNFDIAPLNRILGLENSYVDGRINGDIEVNNLLKDQVIGFDLIASNLRVNSDTLGEARAAGSFDVSNSLITLKEGSGLSYKNSNADVEGTYSLKKESHENIDATINFNHAEVKWATPFLAGYVHQLTGEVNGEISIKGNAFNPVTTGSLTLSKVGFVPDITGVHYTIEDAVINVTDSKFDFGAIHVKDDDNNEGILAGSILHTRLSNFNFRLNMRSDNIKVIDLKDYQNANFYGDVKASVQLRLSGPADNLNLNIFATPQRNSQLFIPIVYGNDVGEYDYVHFKEYGETQHPLMKSKNKFNIRIDAVATPDLETTIIIDPNTKEKIWAKGSGNIILEIPSEGDMRMNGNYIIDEGKYDYSFKQLTVLNYQQQFIINPNSVIKWNGDIANADLDVSAYAQIKARLYDLIINEADRGVTLTDADKRDAQIMQMVNVNMNMKGSLKEPEFHFRIDLAENRSVGTYAWNKLQRINADDKQLYTQVASLLILEQFVPPEGLNNNTATAGVINNMSELASSAASAQFTNFANKILGMQDLSIGVKYKYYTYSDNGTSASTANFVNRNEAGVNLRKNFLKNRLIVEVGGIYDWGRNTTASSGAGTVAGSFAGDFRVQYLLREDGRIRFNVFRTSDYDALNAQLVARQGVGLSYRKSFNGLSDLFRSPDEVKARSFKKMEEQRQQRIDKAMPVNSDTTESIK